MEIYLIRHGTTEWNAGFRLQGKTDIPLDALGMEMARQTGLYFRDQGILFDRVYSSPLSRAYRTALLVTGKLGEDAETAEYAEDAETREASENAGAAKNTRESVDIITDSRLAEISFGTQEGRQIKELVEDDSAPFRYFETDPAQYDRLAKTVEAESLTELCRRTADFLRERVELPAGKCGSGESEQVRGSEEAKMERILISAHGACNKGLLMHMRGETDLAKFWGEGLQLNCGLDRIEYDPASGVYRILESNQICYPEELLRNFRNLL